MGAGITVFGETDRSAKLVEALGYDRPSEWDEAGEEEGEEQGEKQAEEEEEEDNDEGGSDSGERGGRQGARSSAVAVRPPR